MQKLFSNKKSNKKSGEKCMKIDWSVNPQSDG